MEYKTRDNFLKTDIRIFILCFVLPLSYFYEILAKIQNKTGKKYIFNGSYSWKVEEDLTQRKT